jgi:hypothetical protein
MGNHDSPSNASTIVLLRTTLDEVFSDHRFFVRKSASPCQIPQYVLTKIRQGERDLDRLKTATLEKFNGDYRVREHPATRGKRGTANADLALDSGDLTLPPAAWGTFDE